MYKSERECEVNAVRYMSKENGVPGDTYVAEENVVRYVMEGSFGRVDSQIQIDVQLKDVHIGLPFWTEQFKGSFNDLASIQDQIVQSFVNLINTAEPLTRDTMKLCRVNEFNWEY